MLTILLGRDWVSNRDAILEMVARDVQEEKENVILIVPELISHDTERRLCLTAGDSCSRYAEVLSFSRLCSRVSEKNAQGVPPCLDNGGRVVAMAAAARQLHSKLKAYACVLTKPEFLSSLVDAVDEFKRCCITSEDLKHAAGIAEGSFAQKLEELSLLLEGYNSICARGIRDPRDQLQWLLEQLEDSNFAESHRLYVDGFPDFTVQHMRILQHFITYCPNVVISINCDCPGSANPAFEKPSETLEQILRYAKENHIPYQIQYQPPAGGLVQLCEKLFDGDTADIHYSEDELCVTHCDGVFDECTAAAERVLQFVRSGARYRDVGVVCCDMERYEGALRLVFGRCSIPFYLSGKEDILEKSVITTVLAALDTVIKGFDQSDVLRYLRSILSPLRLSQTDKIENYILLWNIDGDRFFKDWKNHPAGLTEVWSEEDHATLASLNELRKLALSPLYRLSRSFHDAVSLRQQVQALYAFLEEINLAQRMTSMASQMEETGEWRSAQIMSQLWEILLQALSQMSDVLGDTQWDAEAFSGLLRLLLSQYDVGTIPAVLDSVTVGTVSAMRCQQVKHLIVLGAEEGCLPTYGSCSGVLTDYERSALRNMGVPLTGGALDGLLTEYSEIYGVFCGARNSLWVSCSGDMPSFLYRRLLQMSEGERNAAPILECICGRENETASYLLRHRRKDTAVRLGLKIPYDHFEASTAFALGRITEETVRRLYGRSLQMSASQVDQQAECRLAYFLKYGLNVRERKTVSIDPAEYGTYVHDVLEKTVQRIMELGGFQSVTLEETLEIAQSFSDKYCTEHFDQIDSSRLNYLFQRNCKELEMVVIELWQELQTSDFMPAYCELAFGQGRDVDAISIDGSLMHAQLRGFVDRVDIWDSPKGQYFRVVDYKTGKKDFDYCDVFNGLGLQMLLYLFALERSGKKLLGEKPLPAGVQYFPARVPYLPADGSLDSKEAERLREKQWKRKGLLLSDEEVLYAMENKEDPQRLCCTRKKDGSLSGDLADAGQMKRLRSYVFQVLGKMVDDIASGNVEANPYTRGIARNACMFCPYGSICNPADIPGRRDYKAMSAQRFWEELEKEVDRHG